MDERIFFKFTIDIPDIDKSEPDSQTSVCEHHGELLFKDPTNITLKIFYLPLERLDRKIMGWQTDYSYRLLSKFIVSEVKSSYQNLLMIDFTEYEYSGMQNSTEFHESGFEYFTIQLTGIKLIYKSDIQSDSEIYLNGTAFNLIELHYRYHYNLPWKNDQFKWEPTNKVKDWIKFNDISFIPEHRFITSTKSTDTKVSLEKLPRLRIKNNNDLSESEIKTHVNLLCDLYSFYCHKEITWTESKIYSADKLYYEVKRAPSEDNKMPHGIFIWDFIQNPLNLIRKVDTAFMFKEASLVGKMIRRFNYSFKVPDESKFMILYGLLEELRNQYIQNQLIEKDSNGNPNRAKEEYDFVLRRKDVDAEIEKALELLVSVVDPRQQAMFRQDIKHKVLGIRVMSMTNQFRSYFEFIKVNPDTFGLDFSKLKSLRDKIFHGRKLDDSLDTLKKAVWFEHLPRFTGILLLKFFGIESVDKIEKVKP
ncbi:hypothetical protein [Chryseolinea sp. H1M3-3]|uniref:hypothetical protein n=1 Tax=Chryseolinea sp. H1M3-3 TaxID=3034144 RepID=UPI0023EA95A1|nr:hypothetical protein [Chryseolinea sp. H1M3-3]